MQRLEVSGAVRPIYGSLGVKGILFAPVTTNSQIQSGSTNLSIMKTHAVNKKVLTSIRAEGVAPALSNSDRAFCKISWSGFVPSPEFFYCRQQWTDKRTEKFPITKSPKDVRSGDFWCHSTGLHKVVLPTSKQCFTRFIFPVLAGVLISP